MGKKFDLAGLIAGQEAGAAVSDSDTGKQQIRYIPLELIDPDPDNFYTMEGLEELAGSIEMLGLQQPLLVRPGENGHYITISGHRRRAAIQLISEGGSGQFAEGVPCIVDESPASDALRELKLIMANADTRKMNSADQGKQAERIEDLLRELVDEGYEFPGRLSRSSYRTYGTKSAWKRLPSSWVKARQPLAYPSIARKSAKRPTATTPSSATPRTWTECRP